MGALGGDAEVGADGEDALVLEQAGAGVPAVGELLLLVDEGELFALVGLGLDAPDLVGGGLVVEQQDDEVRTGARPSKPSAPASSWLALAASRRRCPS